MDMLKDLGSSSSSTSFKPKPDSPSNQTGFLVYEDTLFSIDYPNNWTKDTIPLGKYTAVESTPTVEFSNGPDGNTFVAVTMNVIGNRLLTDYANEEVNALKTIEGFKLENTTQTTMGGNAAQEIVYTTSEIKDGVLAGTSKTMEVITIKGGTAHHLVFKTDVDDFDKIRPSIEKMINSFKFKEISF
jgi:hypothetical protein